MHKWIVPALFLLAWAGAGVAATTQSVTVGHEGKRYHIDLHASIAANVADAWRIFKDFEALPEVDPVVTKVHSTRLDKHHYRVMVVVHGCVLFFCKDVKQVQNVRIVPAKRGGVISGRVIPEDSDFSYGIERWDIHPCPKAAGRTCLHFTATVQPKFWIPMWLGSLLVEHKMQTEAEQFSRGVEKRAQQGIPVS